MRAKGLIKLGFTIWTIRAFRHPKPILIPIHLQDLQDIIK